MLFENVKAEDIDWGETGLIPVVTQDYYSGRVLMLAFVNRESFDFMQEKGEACYWSRSRNELWHKGATSGDIQKIKHIALNCENNSLLITAVQMGKGACHKGTYTCYGDEKGAFNIFERDFDVIKDRAINPKQDSYTNYLFDKGIDKICKKIGEEATEVIIAAKNKTRMNLTEEISDLAYHLLVLMHECGITPKDVIEEMEERSKQ